MRNRSLQIIVLLATAVAFSKEPPAAYALGLRQSASAASGIAQTSAAPASGNDSQTEKQKALADQAKRLVDMATELKTQVSKTNKNILSLEVVRKAEEIEILAHRMKEQSKLGGR